jgi:hypothetical protein
MYRFIAKTKFLRTMAFVSGLPLVQPIVVHKANTAELYGRFKRR